MKLSKVVITGANGFIGSHLCNTLCNNGTHVIAVVHNNADNLIPNPNLVIIKDKPDLINEIRKITNEIDCFYHFAWSSAYNSSDCFAQIDNITNTCNAVHLAHNLNCQSFIFPGTVMEYSFAKIITQDHSKPGTRNFYYTAKQAASLMAKTLCNQLDVAFIEAAITNAYGPGSNKNSFMNAVLMKMISDKQVDLSPGTQLYDFIYITDLTAAMILLGERGEPNCTYYIGSNNPRTVKEYVLMMNECTHSKSQLNFGAIAESTIGLDVSAFDIHKIYQKLGFESSVSLEQGINKTIQWLKSL